MNCEPHGRLKLNTKHVEQLGLQNASKLQLQLISSFIISKPMSLVEVTFICLDIPIIHKSWAIKYINSTTITSYKINY
jgi:hypothetical protein